jgi:hypothetical protein
MGRKRSRPTMYMWVKVYDTMRLLNTFLSVVPGVLVGLVSRFPVVFLVRRAISSVCLKMLVMYVVSLPMYVKRAHFWGVCLLCFDATYI